MNNDLHAVEHVSQYKLRKQAQRGLRVLDRYKQSDPAITAHEPTFVPAAEGFMAVYDRVQTFETTRKREVVEGRQAIEELYTRTRAWMGALERDVPGFQAGQLRGGPDDPDALLGDAKRMIELANGLEGAAYVPALTEDLSAALAHADEAWRHMQDILSEHQRLLAEARTAAVLINRELVALRRTLRSLLGTSNRDYQKLRTKRVFDTDESEDEPIIEDQPNPLTTAAQPTNGHSRPTMEATHQ